MTSIHPTAIVDRRAQLGDDVKIGPYAVIEGAVRIGSGSIIESHSVLRGPTEIGARCRIGPAAYVGLDPQHLKFNPNVTESWLIVGEECVIREGVSLHRSTHEGIEHATRIGKRCFLMANSHVAHDAQVGDDVVMANAVLLGGHVTVGQKAFLGGGAGVHQFCRIGRLVVVAGNESIARDIPPFAAARYGGIKGYNAVGCRRAGIGRAGIHAIREAFHCLHNHRTMPAALEAIRALDNVHLPVVREILDFIATSNRGIQPSVRFLGGMYGRVVSADSVDSLVD
jgi:UDP-N-acetylglucosamine acyltransferase